MQLEFFEDNSISFDTSLPTKVCAKCQTELPLSAFSPASGGKYPRSECKKCANELSRVRNLLRSTTPLPPQDHVCPICLRTAEDANGMGNKNNGSWVLDHDHISKEARGWICHTCNRGIGAFSDDVSSFERVLEYLKEYL